MQYVLLPVLDESTKPEAGWARRLAAHMWTSVRNDLTFLFYCKTWKRNHAVDKTVVDRLFANWLNDGENDFVETECLRCHSPVYVCSDPDDPAYYLVSEAPYLFGY